MARSQLENGCLAGDQNLPRIKFLSMVKNSLVGNKNTVYFLKFYQFSASIFQFLCTKLKSKRHIRAVKVAREKKLRNSMAKIKPAFLMIN